MDRLTAFVAIAHARLRLDIVQKHPYLLERDNMATPKLQGVRQAMALLRHNLEADAEKLRVKIGNVDTERTGAFAAGHAELDATRKEIAEIQEFLADIEGSNGAPTSGGSSATSDQPRPDGQSPTEPAASWASKTA